MDKVNTAKKLKALADHGGTPVKEKVAALIRLEKILAKYDISLEDLNSHDKHNHTINYRHKTDKDILMQVIGKVLNVNGVSYRQKGRQILISVTDSEFIKIKIYYDAYRHVFKKEIATLFQAFVNKHSLSGEATGDDDQNMPDDEAQRMVSLMRGLQDVIIPSAMIGDGETPPATEIDDG